MNHDPIATLADGSRLVLSTRYIGEVNFRCELHRVVGSSSESERGASVYMVEAGTCREAQALAYAYAARMYMHSVIKKPPYLIWSSDIVRFEPQRRRARLS